MSHVKLDLKIVPGAATEGLAGWLGDRLKIRVRAPADKGKANAAVLALLAEALDIPMSSIWLISGQSSAQKQVAISGLNERLIRARLNQAAQQKAR